MGSKTKVILKSDARVGSAGEARLSDAMRDEFPVFSFDVVQDHGGGFSLTATGEAWALPANQRPAMGTMSAWASGYIRCLETSGRIDDSVPQHD